MVLRDDFVDVQAARRGAAADGFGPREYFFDFFNVLDLFYSLGQLVINVAVTLKREAPELFSPIFEYAEVDDGAGNVTAAARRALKAGKGGTSGVDGDGYGYMTIEERGLEPTGLVVTLQASLCCSCGFG